MHSSRNRSDPPTPTLPHEGGGGQESAPCVLWTPGGWRGSERLRLLRALYSTDADLLPDANAGTLTVRVHHQANRCADEVIRHFCNELNQTETIYPGPDLRLVYELVSE